MRKIIFIAITAIMLVSAFAMVASATEITYSADFGEVTNIDGMPAIDGIDTSARVVLKNSDGTYTTYPTYYIMKNSKTFGTDYTNLNDKNTLGQTYSDASMILIEIPDGVTGISSNLFGMDSKNHPTTSLEKIVILSDDYETIGQQTFRRMPTVKSVTISKSITFIDSWAFCGSPALQEVIFEEGSMLETMGNSFSGCTALSSINLENCTSLKTLNGTFDGCTSLRRIALPDSIETIGDNTFRRIGELTFESDYLPNNLKTIGGHFLSSCTVGNEVLYFPVGFNSLTSSYNFNDGCPVKTKLTLVFLGKMTYVKLDNFRLTDVTNSGEKKPLTIVFAQNTFDELNGTFIQGVEHNGVFGYIYSKADGTAPYTVKENGTLTLTLINNDPNSETSLGEKNGDKIYKAEDGPVNIVFCGGETVEQCYSVRTNETDKGWFRFFTTKRAYDIDAHKASGVHYNNRVIQAGNCGYDETATNTCVICDEQSVVVLIPATGLHTYTDDYNCETQLTCQTCDKVLKEALTHVIKTTVNYENGYAQIGFKTVGCQNEGCSHGTTEEVPAMFVCIGFSAPENGAFGIALGYNVDKEAIAVYVSITGKSLDYGVFAVAKNKLGANDVLDENGVATEGVIKAPISSQNYDFKSFSIKITGFKTDKQMDAKLALGAYVIVSDGEALEISYIQDSEPTEEGAKYSFVSYNSIKEAQ